MQIQRECFLGAGRYENTYEGLQAYAHGRAPRHGLCAVTSYGVSRLRMSANTLTSRHCWLKMLRSRRKYKLQSKVNQMSGAVGKSKSFIIHLPNAVGRKAQVDHLLAATPYEAEVLDAVEGPAMSDEELQAVYSNTPIHHPKYPFPLNAAEVGCFLSHRRAWQKIVDDGLEAALILEDDVQIEGRIFANALALAETHADAFGYIQFQVRPVKGAVRTLARTREAELVAPKVIPLRTSAQLVSAKAAAVLLESTSRFDRPIDSFLQMRWATSVPVVCAVPSGVSDRTAQTGGSSISRETTLGEKLKREILRFSYRSQIKFYSRASRTQKGF